MLSTSRAIADEPLVCVDAYQRLWRSARFEPEFSNGSRLAAHATIAGTHTGEFFAVAATGKRLRWRVVHAFEVRDGQIAEHWMDSALLAAYMQMMGQGEPDAKPPRPVTFGLAREYTAGDQRVPITGYMNMVASHDAATVREWATDGYLQHGPFGPNVTRDEFEAGNRDVVWSAPPDISIQLEPLLAEGDLVAARGLRRGTHTGSDLFGVPAGSKQVKIHRDAHLPPAGHPSLRALASGRPPRPARPAEVLVR